MAIKDPILFITVEEFKNSKYFNELLFDKVTTPDNEIWFAISVASSNIDYLSGFTISKKWPEITPTDFTDNIQTATTHYVRFLLTKDVDYLRGQGSISQGGLTYSETNPDDPYFIPPEVFNCLRKIKEYPNIKGFNLKGIEPQKNHYFNKFISNCGEDSPLNAYIPYNNIKSLDSRTKITISHPQNMLRPVVNIDTNNIKSLDNLTTLELFTKYFSNDAFQLVDGKEKQQPKVISINDEIGKLIESKQSQLTSENAGDNITITGNGANIKINSTGGTSNSLWEIDPNSSNIIQPKEKRIITSNNTRIVDIADPEQPQDGANKRYVDKKQDKLTAGTNITIDKVTNTISATGGKTDLTDYYKKEEVDKKFETKDNHGEDISRLLTDMINIPISTEYAELKTQAKTIINAINEINKKQPSGSNWKAVGTIAPNYSTVNYNFKVNKLYRLSFTWKAINIKKTVIQYLNFYVETENVEFTILATMYQENNQDWRLCMSKDLIAVINRNSERLENCIFKLEELQE